MNSRPNSLSLVFDRKIHCRKLVVTLIQDIPDILHGVLKTGCADEPVLLKGSISKSLDDLGFGNELGLLDRVNQSLLE